jgi:uncharacterized protein YndB with AHSA1/START domain
MTESREYGEMTAPETVRFERVLPGPIERVWAYLTDSEKRGRWLATGPMEPRVGGRVELRFRHADLSPRSEVVPEKYRQYEGGASFTGRITAWDPPRRLSHTWAEASGEDSEVTYELTPRGDEVLLELTHRRLVGREAWLSVASGWHTHLVILADHLADRVPDPFWSTHARLEGEYEEQLSALAAPTSAETSKR